MRFSFLLFVEPTDRADPAFGSAELAAISGIVEKTAKLTAANLYIPGKAKDLFRDEEVAPAFGMQLYFDELSDLEAAISPRGELQQLTELEVFSSRQNHAINQQAMYVRPFPVDHPDLDIAGNGNPCSYVVHYPGPAQDLNAWLDHYLSHHPQIMRTFPGIRGIEILTRVDWVGFLPWTRVNHMQRNRVLFDSQTALTQALQSPARIAMRDDFQNFPPFDGGNCHYPMETIALAPRCVAAAA